MTDATGGPTAGTIGGPTAGPAGGPAPDPGTEPGRRVLVLNGPNLGRLGSRQPTIYGSTTHAELVSLCEQAGRELGLDVQVRQSDSEADLLHWLHEAADEQLPVVLNAGAFTHTSVALRDAAAARTAPLVEVHISNVHAREPFRHHSYLSAVASGVIVGLGIEGYVLALSWISSVGRDR
ncbi:type II 3-dehydroquinate dehydratase [Jatrophihabitans telluris]|uniref:3-dehydroquinate dehydratase n=1 Tax=Jatrophihabitans telluris TaxID=2038343 RepID=A0ABY4QUN7_9ACTN|nr:type II 3-dehydroquinate dehydratase [Jatrophihabitans telluris]UQX86781.1 type II 3-dehydroquinate dehydratase [Jatrophihabitans telluris]